MGSAVKKPQHPGRGLQKEVLVVEIYHEHQSLLHKLRALLAVLISDDVCRERHLLRLLYRDKI